MRRLLCSARDLPAQFSIQQHDQTDMLVELLSRENVSTLLGYSSIVAWLFAQMPQVRARSDGLPLGSSG